MTANRALCQPALHEQPLLTTVFDFAQIAAAGLAKHAPDVDRDRVEFAVATVLLEEAWVSQR